jgi:hypothetical protein
MKRIAIASAALCLLAGAALAQEKVKVPIEALGEILKRYPDGHLISEKDFDLLLEKAGISKLSELAQPPVEKPPVGWSVEGCEVTGNVSGDQASFEAEARVRVLDSKRVVLGLPLANVGARVVKLDGVETSLVKTAETPFGVVLPAKGEHTVHWEFTLPVEKLEERGAGAFTLPLLRAAVAAHLRVELSGGDGLFEASSAQCSVSVEHHVPTISSVGPRSFTSIDAAVGARDVVRVEFRPSGPDEAHATAMAPYVAVNDAGVFVLNRGLVELQSLALFQIHRAAVERLSIELPAGFVVRDLEGDAREPSGQRAPWGGTWVQRGDRVDLVLPKARDGELRVALRAELVAPQEGTIDLALPSYPGSARSSGLTGVARGEDMTVVVSREKALERADLDENPLRSGGSLLRVYRHGTAASGVSVAVKPVEPKVVLTFNALETLRDKELLLGANYRFLATEGSVYQLKAELPSSFTVDEVHVTDPRGQELKHELRTETKDATTTLLVDLEGGLHAGSTLVVSVRASREVPNGIASERGLEVPRLTGSPANETRGYVGFAVDPAFRLRGDVKGLLPVPVEALARAGIGGELALGFKVDRPDYSGALSLAKRETRIAARSLVYYQIDERTIATDARLEFEVQGAPVDSLELVLPKGSGKLARIEGDGVAEQAMVAEKDASETWRVHFQGPRSGKVTLLVHFDTEVPGFEKAEGAAKTHTLLPIVHAGDGCERERGQLAVFSSDSTEITAEPERLHAIEVTEVEQHPAVRPAGRPLCAFTYAGLDWKLGIGIERHAPAPVLSAIVEQLWLESSFGRDGVSRHTARFRCKNLSHQFFDLKVPDGARIWSVLVDGQGVKPAADGDQKIIPLTKSSSPDQPVEVAVSYEVRGGSMGRFGSGALAAPALLERGGGEPIPVLKTSWSLALPDEFRYFEFSGNAEGSAPAVDEPLVVQWWDRDPQSLGVLAGLVVLVLALLASERTRTRLAGLGQSVLERVARIPQRLRQQQGTPRRRLVRAAGCGALGLVAGACIFYVVLTLPTRRLQQSLMDGRPAPADAVMGPAGYHLDWQGADDKRFFPQAAKKRNSMRAEPEGAAAPAPPPPAAAPVTAPDEPEERAKELELAEKKAMEPPKPELGLPAQTKAPAAAAPRRRSQLAAQEEVEKAAREPEPSFGRLNESPGAPPPPAPTDAPKEDSGRNAAGMAGATIQTVDGAADKWDGKPRIENLGTEAGIRNHRQLAGSSAFGEKGLSSLVLALPYVGKTWTFTHEGGPAEIAFTYVRSDLWKLTLAGFAILGFAAGFFVPRRSKVSFLGLLVLATVLLSTVPYVLFPALTGGPVNAFLAGLWLAAPVVALLAIDRSRLRRVKLVSFVPSRGPNALPLLVLGALLFAATPAHAQERRVFIPYDPDHPERKQDKVFVPEGLYEELWKKAHPNATAAEKTPPPAAYATSNVRYEGVVSTEKGLALKAKVRVEILQEGWVEAPLGLEGASILEQAIEPEGAKLRAAERGYTLLAQGPKTFDLSLTLLLPGTRGFWTAGALRAGAAVVKLSTSEPGMAIKVLGALGGQTETPRQDGGVDVDASLGAASELRIAFGQREVIAHGGGSDATVFDDAVLYVRRGRVELTETFDFAVAGEGRDGFLFTVPEGFEVTDVATDSLRGWRVTPQRVLEVTLRRPSDRAVRVVVRGERATQGASLELPELAARAVSREEGRFAVAVEPGLKVRFGKDDGLRQIDPSEVQSRVRNVLSERAYAFTKRPAKLTLELQDEPLELRATTRVFGVVRSDRMEVVADLELNVKKGRTYELRVLAPSDLELAGDPDGLDVRERVVDKLSTGTRYTFGLAKGLVAPASAVLHLRFTRTLRGDDVRVSVPDLRVLGVAQEEGELALAVAEGLTLKGERDVEPERFASTDPDPIAAAFHAPKDVKAVLGWKRKAGAPSGLSQATALLDHAKAHVEGTAVTFANVERDVVHTVVRVSYELTEAGSNEFSFKLPARLAKRVSVVAPNQREITFHDPSREDGDTEERVAFDVELQSAVKNFYELTLEWEELLPQSGAFDLARLDLVGCDRVRAFVLVEADPSLTDKLEAVPARCANVETARAEESYAFPPGKDAKDFNDSFRAVKPEWRVALELKPVLQEAPAPCRVETARVTSVIHDDGSVLHKAVYRVRNRSLQFLGVRLPQGATVWTVHVAGEPKRIHLENGITLIPLPKRADADLGFEVEVVFKTQLEGPLGLLTKVAPQAPLLATKGVTVERTFWSLYLPPRFDALWTSGNMDETAAAVSDAQQIKARVQELTKLSSLAENGRSENERQTASSNVGFALEAVQRDYSVALDALTHAQSASNSAQVQGQLLVTTKELNDLKGALGEVTKRQQAYVAKQQAQQGAPAQGAKTDWVYANGAFTLPRQSVWEGLEQQADELTAQKNHVDDERIERQRLLEREKRGEQLRKIADDTESLAQKPGEGKNRPGQMIRNFFGGGGPGGGGGGGGRGDDANKDAAGIEARISSDSNLAGDITRDSDAPGAKGGADFANGSNLAPKGAFVGRGGVGLKDIPTLPESRKPVDAIAPGFVAGKPERVVDLYDGQLQFNAITTPQGATNNYAGEVDRSVATGTPAPRKLEEAEKGKSLLSIGFDFEIPQASESLHFTTASNADDGMQLTLGVVPRASVERAGRTGKALVVLLLVFAVAKLGLLGGSDKKAARALGLVVAGSLAGLIFVHVAFAAVAVLASLVALVRARTLRAA